MIGLNRHLAPLSERAWQRIESEARDVLKLHLSARRLVDFTGPLGWEYSAIDLGSVEPVQEEMPNLLVRKRRVRPLVELRSSFTLERAEVERIDRGASAVDLDPAREAARSFAAAEDHLLLQGSRAAEIPGILTDSTQAPVQLPEETSRIPEAVAQAIEQLRLAGVAGPYVAAFSPPLNAAVNGSAGEGGYPVIRHIEALLDRRVVFVPSLASGGAVLSMRGGDRVFVCGRDVAIGYESHDERQVTLFLEESFGAELQGPEAAVALSRAEPGSSARRDRGGR